MVTEKSPFPVVNAIPLIHVFRYPTKFLLAGILPVALLSGYASDVHFGPASSQKPSFRPSPKLLTGMWSIGAILCVLSILLMVSEGFSNWFQEFFFKQSGNEMAYRGLAYSCFHAFGLWSLFTLL